MASVPHGIRGGGSGRGRGLIPHCCVLVCSPVSLGAVTGSHQDAQSHATPPGPSHFRSTPQPPEEPERGLGSEGKWELRQDGKQVWRAPARTRLALGGGTKGKRQNWVRWRGPLGFGGGTLIQDRVRSSLLRASDGFLQPLESLCCGHISSLRSLCEISPPPSNRDTYGCIQGPPR